MTDNLPDLIEREARYRELAERAYDAGRDDDGDRFIAEADDLAEWIEGYDDPDPDMPF